MSGAEDIAGIVREKFEEAMKERGQVNIIIAGRTGVGKSTLINEIFQGKLADTGQGRPVTHSTREISKEGIPLTILDTRGLELAAYDQIINELEQLIISRSRERDANRHIHVAWLCILEDGRRVEDAEIKLHNMLSQHMPVIGVITKSRSDQGFKATVQELLPQTRNVVRVRALAEELDEGQLLAPMGLTDLVDLTLEVLPESFRLAFIAAQKACIQQKKNSAHKIVAASVATATAAGAAPIPFSDAIILVPIQVGMLAGISSAFGLDLTTGFLATLVAASAGSAGATVLGKTIVSNLIKLVPGAGSAAGAMISGATAASLTTSLGEIYIATLEALFTDSPGQAPSAEQIIKEFKSRLP